MRGSTSVYCSLLRHEALERSILWLTGKGGQPCAAENGLPT